MAHFDNKKRERMRVGEAIKGGGGMSGGERRGRKKREESCDRMMLQGGRMGGWEGGREGEREREREMESRREGGREGERERGEIKWGREREAQGVGAGGGKEIREYIHKCYVRKQQRYSQTSSNASIHGIPYVHIHPNV